MPIIRAICALLSVALALPLTARAAPLDLDLTFNASGTLTLDFGLDAPSANDTGHAVAVQPDGKIVVVGSVSNAGQTDFGIIRVHMDGSLDASFGDATVGPGQVVTDVDDFDGASDVLIQPDGRILVVGRTGNAAWSSGDVVLVRYLPDGALDPGFGNGGIVRITLDELESGRAIGLQPSGAIVVLASQERPTQSDPYLSDFLVLRLTPTGQLDASFADVGIRRIAFGNNWNSPSDLAVSGDGRITVVGITAQLTNLIGDKAFGAIARLKPNGAFDTSFDGGLPVVCATFSSCGRVVTDLGGGPYDFPSAVALRRSNGIEDGTATVSGRFGLARYLANGALDPTFSGNGINTAAVNTGADLALRNDGSIVRVGESSADFGVAIYASDGTLDAACAPGAQSAASTDFFGLADRAGGVAMHANGEIVVAGVAKDADNDFAIARYRGGDCGNATSALLNRAFLAYHLFVHPQDKVGPNWPGWLGLLPLEQPAQLAVPMAARDAAPSSPYLRFELADTENEWQRDTVAVTTALGTTVVRPRALDSVLIPVHLRTSSRFVPRASAARGYACYRVDGESRFEAERMLFESALGERRTVATSAVTQLCTALDENEGRSGAESRYLVCLAARAGDWRHGPVAFDGDGGPIAAGEAKAGAAALLCLNADLRAHPSAKR